jgi:hypothetical protein
MFQQARQFFELQTFSRIHQQRRSLQVTFAPGMQLSKNRHQFYRQIVDAVVAHVLKRFEDRALSRPGQPSEDNKLPAWISRGS